MKLIQTGCADRLDMEYEMEKSRMNPWFVFWFCFCFCLRKGVTFTEMGKTAGGKFGMQKFSFVHLDLRSLLEI